MDMRDDELLAPERAAAAAEPAEPLFDLGGDERRMHVRAYNHWVSLLKGRPWPVIDDLHPDRIADFGAHGVLLDFGGDVADPSVRFLGRALRDECGIDGGITRVAEVPPRSLLSRLTDHHLQIIANKAPIGFEAEFVSQRGRTTLYRGILMPFSSAPGGDIDFIYGVINWKEVADAAVQASLDAALDASLRSQTRADAPAWADGPSAAPDTAPLAELSADGGSLADTLMLARETAAAVRAADTRSRAALYRALGRAHDFGLAADAEPGSYAALLAAAGVSVQARAPMTPVVKLVFGVDYDKTRLTEFAAVLGHARRHGIGAGRLSAFLEGFEGGIKAVVAAERVAKRPPAAPARARLADRPALARLEIAVDAAAGAAVVLVARMGADGVLDVVDARADEALAARALRSGRPPRKPRTRG